MNLKDRIKKYVAKQFMLWWKRISKGFERDFVKAFVSSLIGIILMIFMIPILFQHNGILNTAGFVCTTIWKFDKVFTDYRRPVFWALGYIIASFGAQIAKEEILPKLTVGGASIITIGLLLYVVLIVIIKSKEIKNY